MRCVRFTCKVVPSSLYTHVSRVGLPYSPFLVGGLRNTEDFLPSGQAYRGHDMGGIKQDLPVGLDKLAHFTQSDPTLEHVHNAA